MKVTHQQGIDLFKALDYNATDAWTPERLASKLNALPQLIGGDAAKQAALKKKSKDLGKLLTQIITAVEGGDTITLAQKGKADNVAKKSKPPVDDEDEDDIEEEEDEDTEDDSDENDEEDSDEEDEDGDAEEDDNDDDDSESEDDDEDGEDDEEPEDEEGGEGDDEEDEEEAEEEDSDDEGDDDEDDEPEVVAGATVEHEKHGTCEVLKVTGDTVTIKKENGKLVKGVAIDDLVVVDDEDETEDEDTDEEDEDVADEATAVAKKPAKKTGTPVKGKAPPKSAGGDGKPGVIASIAELLRTATKDKPITKKKIVDALAKRFKDRNPEALLATVNIQVPTRLRKEKGLNVQKNDKGYYIAPGKPTALPAKASPTPAAKASAKKKKK